MATHTVMRWAHLAWTLGLVLGFGRAWADGPPPGATYKCTTGRSVTSADRMFPDCQGIQSATSTGGNVTYLLTPEQQRIVDKCRQDLASRIDEWKGKIRHDNSLLSQYPDEATLNATLEPMQARLRQLRERLAELAAQRKPLIDETEFYVGKTLPPALKRKIDENDALVAAQKELIKQNEDEVRATQAKFEQLRAELKALWANPTHPPMPSADCTVPTLFHLHN